VWSVKHSNVDAAAWVIEMTVRHPSSALPVRRVRKNGQNGQLPEITKAGCKDIHVFMTVRVCSAKHP